MNVEDNRDRKYDRNRGDNYGRQRDADGQDSRRADRTNEGPRRYQQEGSNNGGSFRRNNRFGNRGRFGGRGSGGRGNGNRGTKFRTFNGITREKMMEKLLDIEKLLLQFVKKSKTSNKAAIMPPEDVKKQVAKASVKKTSKGRTVKVRKAVVETADEPVAKAHEKADKAVIE